MSAVGQSFEEWYEARHARLLATILLATGSLDVAEDAVDEAFTRALLRWDRVSGMASPEAWTYRVAVNVARRRWRRESFERHLLRSVPAPPDVPPPGNEAWEAVRHLPRRQRTAVVLRHVADLTESDVAKVMGVTRSTVSATLAHAHRSLAVLLSSERSPTEVPRA